jgi:hypothetical protein
MSLAQATKRAGFEPLLPSSHGKVYADEGILATYLDARTVLTEARGDLAFAKKVASQATRILPVTVNGNDGLWISGAPHVVTYFESSGLCCRTRVVRVAGNVLVWARDGLTLRIEGPLTRAEALRLAESIR